MSTASRRTVLELADMRKAARAPSESYVAAGPLSLDQGETNLVWDKTSYADDDPHVNRLVRPSRRTLDQFVELEGAPPSRILAFARRWGLLELCRHSLPRTHNGRTVTAPCKYFWRCEQEVRRGRVVEPIAQWRDFVGQAAAVLRVAAAFYTESAAAAEDLELLAIPDGPYPHPIKKRWYRGLAFVWSEYWLELAQLSPMVWSDGRITFHAGFDEKGGLFGNLALHLALAIVRSDGFGICAGCRVQFTPRKQGQRWCGTCRKSGKAAKLGMRELRVRQRQSK